MIIKTFYMENRKPVKREEWLLFNEIQNTATAKELTRIEELHNGFLLFNIWNNSFWN